MTGTLNHLQAEFKAIDTLLRCEVRRFELAGQDANDDYRGLYVSAAEVDALFQRPFATPWGQSVSLPSVEEEAFAAALRQARQGAEDLAVSLDGSGDPPRLIQIARAFGLDRTALDIFLLCLAPALDPAYERIYGYLQDNVTKRRPTVRLALDLLGEPGIAHFALMDYFCAESPLFKYHLIETITEAPPHNAHWINQTLQVDEGVVAWLLGHYQAHGVLGEATLQRIRTATDCSRDGDVASTRPTRPTPSDLRSAPPIWLFHGVDSEQQRVAAEEMAEEAGQALLTVQLNKVVNENTPAWQVIRMALRDARLTGAVAFLRGWDVCLNSDEMAEPALLRALCEHPGRVIVASQKRWQPTGIDRQRPCFQRAFGLPTYEQRLAHWQNYLTETETETLIPSSCHPVILSGLPDLAAQFALTSGQIRDAVQSARDRAMQAGQAVPIDTLFEAARTHSSPRLTSLARKVTPRYDWGDIILAGDEREKLQETIAAIRHRNKVLDEWGVAEKLAAGRGVMLLFSGPPGTGKTMAAEVVAKELRLDLYKIDLSGVVSKYIGETEKNLERIFSEAANSNAILFFDEADAIFGKRSEVKDAHDRYANLEVAYLLQRMESYEGITVLATNMRANLDEAFLRRFHSTIDFPFPKRTERLRIWQALFPAKVQREATIDFEFLANRFELAGGNIRNIIVNAAYLAANNGNVVTMEHLQHAARREMQKMGRLVGE